ncbi:MAG TPA: YiaA/YiaB family inner membrane protein [Anaerolineae bacterium]|jgi:hypothetical protein|nr:YiaA/YiaB family inner membrane protein [Anaerolineae bacterium]
METIQKDSAAWQLFVWVNFICAVMATSFGVLFLPIDFWFKGYMAMGLLFTIGSTFSLSKAIRDEHETKKLVNKIQQAKTEKMLKEYELN